MNEKNYSKVPVFENGLAQPVFPLTDGKTGEKYDPATSSIVRYCVYVETDYDVDGDGKRDLVKAVVQVPRSAVEGNYKAATLYEARPYAAGVQEDGYPHMKEVAEKEYHPVNFADLDKKVDAHVPQGCISAMDLSLKADPADWYYPDKGNNNSMVFENIDTFDYYLVRGFAVVLSAGFGSKGSDGFNYVGSDYERDAFKAIVEWLHGDRIGYADREGVKVGDRYRNFRSRLNLESKVTSFLTVGVNAQFATRLGGYLAADVDQREHNSTFTTNDIDI